MNCKYCSKLCKNNNSLTQHQIRCKLNPRAIKVVSNFIKYNKRVKNGTIEKLNSNQFTKARREGIVVEVSQETRNKISEKIKKRNADGYWTNERRKKHSNAMKRAVKNNPDSYSISNVSGRTKTLIYNGFKLKGSWELEVAKWLDKQSIKWTNIIDGIEYNWNGSIHLYFPDFYLTEMNLYIEVKGYERDRDLAKWKVVPNLIVFRLKEINAIKSNNLGLISPQPHKL